jgi:hypothetical protein
VEVEIGEAREDRVDLGWSQTAVAMRPTRPVCSDRLSPCGIDAAGTA